MAAAKKKAEDVQGIIESMAGLPGEGTQIVSGDEPLLDPVIQEDTEYAAIAGAHSNAMSDEEKARLSELGTTLRVEPDKSKSRAHNLDERPRKFKVWEHGAMELNGMTHKSGSIVEIHPRIAKDITCLEPVVENEHD